MSCNVCRILRMQMEKYRDDTSYNQHENAYLKSNKK
jgi:hypothetical protein